MLAKVILLALFVAQATQPTPSTQRGRFNEAGFIVTRMDAISAFRMLERTLHEHPVLEAERARVHRDFDRLTGLYFIPQYSQTVRALHELNDSISPQAPQSVEAKLARAMRVRIAPPISSANLRMGLRVKVSPMYTVEMDAPAKLALEIVREGEEKPVLHQDIVVETNGLTPIFTLKQPTSEPGKYRIDLVAPDGFRDTKGYWHVVDRSLDLVRELNANHLRVLSNPSEQMTQARAAVVSRNTLLTDRPQEIEAVRYFANPNELLEELAMDVREIESGNDPFTNRRGDYWRTVYLGDLVVPVRVYAPPNLDADKQAPLVIVLHGPGGEEGMFFDGYGFGEIKRQADKHGFIVVSPRMEQAKHARDPVNGLVRALAFNFAIDRERVYVIGHSTGALVAQAWAGLDESKLAAVVQISGASEFGGTAETHPRTLLIGGDIDLIFPPERLQPLADKAKERGVRVEHRQIRNAGHTLVVGEVLPQVVDWLLTSR